NIGNIFITKTTGVSHCIMDHIRFRSKTGLGRVPDILGRRKNIFTETFQKFLSWYQACHRRHLKTTVLYHYMAYIPELWDIIFLNTKQFHSFYMLLTGINGVKLS